MRHSDVTVEELAIIFRQHEEEFWHLPPSEPAYTRHALEHLAKLIGKLGGVVEPREHGLEPDTVVITREVIPDLLYWALGLAEQFDLDLPAVFAARLEQNAAKIEERRRGSLAKG